MKLRTKFIILAILVALLTGLSLLVYVAYISRTTILSREQNFTRVTSSIAFNAIMEKDYEGLEDEDFEEEEFEK